MYIFMRYMSKKLYCRTYNYSFSRKLGSRNATYSNQNLLQPHNQKIYYWCFACSMQQRKVHFTIQCVYDCHHIIRWYFSRCMLWTHSCTKIWLLRFSNLVYFYARCTIIIAQVAIGGKRKVKSKSKLNHIVHDDWKHASHLG